MNKKIVWVISVVLLIAAAIAGSRFFTVNKPSAPSSAVQSESGRPPMSAMSGMLTIKGFNYGFSPQTIRVKLGDVVNINLVSDDSPHTFTIDELGVNQQFTWGKDTTVTFTASKKGTFQFYCAVPGHRENGQVGTLIVE